MSSLSTDVEVRTGSLLIVARLSASLALKSILRTWSATLIGTPRLWAKAIETAGTRA
ncbi:MAG: hypothetical protein HKL80_05830 [Acidimicrobiales bacterium]|nr:hypothetical protein [Acidimicrobiales bacterium]